MSDPELIRRMRAVEAAQAQFAGKAFRLGKVDCAALAAALLSPFGWVLPSLGGYSTELGAKRKLLRLGVPDMAALIDMIGLVRIAPASARLGDIMFMPGEGKHAIGALTIAMGNGAMLGWHGDHDALVSMRADTVTAAWSVIP